MARTRAYGAVLATMAGLLASSTMAMAADGVVEINPTCAVQPGCFPGDGPGYPVTIGGTAGSSYRLTSDLVVPTTSFAGVSITASGVAVDLNQFSILGASCVGASSSACMPTSGVNDGVAGGNALVTDHVTRDNAGDGLTLGSGAVVRNVASTGNGDTGITAGAGSIVEAVTIRNSGSDGLVIGDGSTVTGISVSSSQDDGIVASTGSTVSDVTSYDNGGDGVWALGGSTVQRSTLRANGGYGLRLAPDASDREVMVTSNGTGTVTSGVNLFNNSCNGATSCP